MSTLPDFPVDDFTLAAIEHALDARLSYDDDGNCVVVGADYTIPKLLDFLSGYDEGMVVPLLDDDGYEIPHHVEYPGSIYSRDDLIRALIVEVRRLRERTDRD